MSFEAKFDQQGLPVIQHELIAPFTLASGRACPEVRLGFCVFAEQPGLPVIILHPALTGSPRAWVPGKSSQGDGWFSSSIGKGKWLDPSKYTIVCVDHLGGNGFSSSSEELSAFKDDLEFVDGITLVVEMLRRRQITNIHSVIGGSIGGGQALEWLFQNDISVERIFDISGSACRTKTASEFFNIQKDLLVGDKGILENIETRLVENTSDLLGQSKAFDHIFEVVITNLKELCANDSKQSALKVARQIGFLRFVTPSFFEQRLSLYREESGDEIQAYERLKSWIEYQGESFLKRFSASALAQLCAMDARATVRSPELVAQAIQNKATKLIGFSVDGDVLFPLAVQQSFYKLVSACLPRDKQEMVHLIEVEDKVNGHDHFLTDNFLRVADSLTELLNN